MTCQVNDGCSRKVEKNVVNQGGCRSGAIFNQAFGLQVFFNFMQFFSGIWEWILSCGLYNNQHFERVSGRRRGGEQGAESWYVRGNDKVGDTFASFSIIYSSSM